MQDLLLSLKQYNAIVKRLDEINEDVALLKLKSPPEVGYIDNSDLLKLLQISNRTAQRWRKIGRLPFCKLGEKFYYRADLILDTFKIREDVMMNNVKIFPDSAVENEYPPPQIHDPDNRDQQMACIRCPLYLILNL